MKRLSLLTSVIFIIISNCTFTYASSPQSGGTITFLGGVYEPQCKVKTKERNTVNIECYRNGQNTIKKSSLKNANKIRSNIISVDYAKLDKKPILSITYH